MSKKSFILCIAIFLVVLPIAYSQSNIISGLESTTMTSTFFVLLIVITLVWAFNLKKGHKFNKPFGIILGLVWIFVLINPASAGKGTVADSNWRESYAKMIDSNKINQEYLVEADYYDYSNPQIQAIIKDLVSMSANANDYTQKVLDYTFQNVEYDFDATDQDCFSATTSKAINRKKGDCDIQGITIIGLLRGAGIAARPVGGCLSKKSLCDFRQTIAGKRTPQYKPLSKANITDLGRLQGIQSRTGGLHLWVEAYLPPGQWVTIEPTSGEIVPKDSCYSYDVELYPSNADKQHICVSTNMTFALECAQK